MPQVPQTTTPRSSTLRRLALPAFIAVSTVMPSAGTVMALEAISNGQFPAKALTEYAAAAGLTGFVAGTFVGCAVKVAAVMLRSYNRHHRNDPEVVVADDDVASVINAEVMGRNAIRGLSGH